MAFSNWYYGMDDASAPSFPCTGDGPNFYLGRLGKGTTSDASANFPYFNKDSAKTAEEAHTFPIWVLEGPGSAPSGVTPEDWGINQANAFFTALGNSQLTGYIGGQTYFVDIEPASSGWTSGDYDNNTATLFGWLTTVTSGNAGEITGGVYIGEDFWNEYFGSDYTSQIPIVVWAAGSPYCPSDCATAASDFNSDYADMVIGGYKVMIWQYYPSGSSGCGGTQDLDITPYSGYQTSKWEPTFGD